MMISKRRGPAAIQFLLVGLGAAALWGMATAYTVDWLHFRRLRDSRVSESYEIRADGEAIITSYVVNSATFEELPDRTLDGQTVPPGDGRKRVGAVAFWRPMDYDFPASDPAHWRFRVSLSSAEQGRNPESLDDHAWWFVRDASDEGRAYLAGFSRKTRLPLGYIGRRGFYGNVPPISEQFITRRMQLNEWLDFGFRHDADSDYDRYIYLLDEDRLQEINLRTHAVRTVAEVPGALSLAVVHTLVPLAEDDANARTINQSFTTRVAAWVGDRVALIHPTTGERVDLALPAELGDSNQFNLYLVDANQSVVVSSIDRRQNWRRLRVTWFGRDGQPTREEHLELAGGQAPTPRELAAVFGLVIPVPALLTMGLVWLGPAAMLNDGSAASYGQAVAQIINISWPAIVLVTVACGGAAAIVYWQEHRRGGGHALAWSMTAFWLGLPAVVAYFAERRPAPLGRCDACGRSTPRNRPACTRCGQDFARPRLLGAEVFA